MPNASNLPALAPFELISYHARDVLKDGSEVHIRSVQAADEAVLNEIITELSPDARYFRYLSVKEKPSIQELRSFAQESLPKHAALIAYTISSECQEYIGVAEFFNETFSNTAELAFAVKTAHQGRGIATALLKHLTTLGRLAGLQQFEAYVHPENSKMLRVFRKCGLPAKYHDDGILVRVTLDISNQPNH